MNAHVQGLVSSPLANGSAADPSFAVTFFSSVGGDTKHEERFTMPTLAQRINSVTASTKDRLGWLKLATFGGARTEKACLRNDANVLKVTGIV